MRSGVSSVRPRQARALLAATVAVVLTGCSAPTPEPTLGADLFAEHGPIMFAVPGNSPAWAGVIAEWNRANPGQPVTLRELSTDPDQRYTALSDAGKASRGEYTVMALEPDWVPEFADSGWVAPLPTADIPTDGLLPAVAEAGTFHGKRYALGVSADADVLYYRKDLLDRAKLKAPRTWNELNTACAAVRTRQLKCLGTALAPTTDLTASVAQAIYSAGGSLVDDKGTVVISSKAATAGVNRLTKAVGDATIPTEALSWRDDQAAQAFADGELVFLQSGTEAWRSAQAAGSASRVAGKVAVARVPGETGYGVAVSGGYQLAIAEHARNQGTAVDFMRWLDSEPAQRVLLRQGSIAPALASIYADPTVAKQPSFAAFADSIKASRALPSTTKFAEFSKDVSDALAPVISGDTAAIPALEQLQKRLTDLFS